MVIQITILFFVCQGSTALYTYLTLFQESPMIYVIINSVATLVNVIDSSCNFFILYSTNMKMRQALLQTALCKMFMCSCFKKKTLIGEQRSWQVQKCTTNEISSQGFCTTRFWLNTYYILEAFQVSYWLCLVSVYYTCTLKIFLTDEVKLLIWSHACLLMHPRLY